MTDDVKTRLDTLIANVKKAITSIPTKLSQLDNDAEYTKKSDIEALSDIQYLTANLFNPENITHGSKYNFTSGAAEASDKMCRTKALIQLDSAKEYNILYYRYLSMNASHIYVFKYDADGKYLGYAVDEQYTSDNGTVMLTHISGAAYIGFHVANFTANYPDRTPQVMIWETTDKTDYNAEFVPYGQVGGKFKLPRLVVDPKELPAVTAKPRFYNEFLKISYSTFGFAPANTLDTYLTAAKLGFDAIKGDVRITSDDKLIMCHDAGFTFGDNGYIKSYVASNSTPIRELTLEQCQSHLYSNSAAMATALGHNCKVATFEDYIKICREYNKVAYITVRDEYIDTIAPIVLDCLKKYNMLGNAIINSFTLESLQKFRALDSDIMLSNVLNSQVALTTSHIDTALSLGNCMVAIFAFPFDNSDTTLSNSAAALTYAQEQGVLVYGAIAKTYEEYAKAVACGLSGLHMQSLMIPYEPQRYSLKVTVADGTTTLTDEFAAERYTATVTQTDNKITIADIRLSGSDRGFDDGVMQLWLNKLPYDLTVKDDSGADCSAVFSGGKISFTTTSSTIYHVAVLV